MWKLNKLFFILLVIIIPRSLFGQKCAIKVNGRVIDEITGAGLPYATVYIENQSVSQSADEEGYFHFDNLCSSNTHIRISHVSCEPSRQFIIIKNDTILNLFLHHHEELMDEVLVHADRNDIRIQNSSTIDQDLIAKESNKSLGELLQSISGVSTLKTGSGIFKPVIHGLYGNRITLLNNGIAQAGQQWGNDHAPEIDPFSADHISVIKGVSALEFSGSSLGSVVLIETDKIKEEPHLHGVANYIFQSNGLGHTLNTEIVKYNSKLSCRLNASIKGIGDQKTPNYYLTNSGRREVNGSLQLEKSFKTWESSLYYSTFNAEIAILRGSHIGNLTDLEVAYKSAVPYFTSTDFSYNIAAPSQKVMHHLMKLKTSKNLKGSGNIVFQYAAQINDRKEFDVRRGGRSDVPALSLFQFTSFLEGNYIKVLRNESFIKTGIQWDYKNNRNSPVTGVLPLIPDYVSYAGSTFGFYQKTHGKAFYEIGGRLDLNELNVVKISTTLPRKIDKYNHLFVNYSLSSGLRIDLKENFRINFNAGYTQRSPAVNELYSFGLHQGVSSIEVGNPNLVSEKSLKLTASIDFGINEKLYVQLLGYYQNITDFIYLQPQLDNSLTIRGAFPLFNYEQTNARLLGADFLVSYEPIQKIRIVSKGAFLRGDDLSNGIPLVYMPSNNVSTIMTFSLPDVKNLIGSSISLENQVVFKQNHLNANQDFVAPPETYQLWGLSFNTSYKHVLGVGLKIENLFNVVYRDYLNRQRYFSDELGRNFNLRINYKF
jgi:iron complex outermembrane receptor protein